MTKRDDIETDSRRPTSAAERRLQRLVVPAPAAYHPNRRIDWVHDPDHVDRSARDPRT